MGIGPSPRKTRNFFITRVPPYYLYSSTGGKDLNFATKCLTDTFSVTGSSPTPPSICGTNTGKHSKCYKSIQGVEPQLSPSTVVQGGQLRFRALYGNLKVLHLLKCKPT